MVGLGVMGTAIAKRLLSLGWEVWGHDINPEAERRATKLGVKIRSIPQMRATRQLITSLPDDAAVKVTLTGRWGLIHQLRTGSAIIETSTVSPKTIRSIAATGDAEGICVIDCALSGGPTEAETGTLTLIVGAERNHLARVLPLITCLGRVVQAGRVGDGKIVKLVNNTMTLGNVLVGAEAFTLGVKAGIPPRRLYEILSASGGRSHQFVKRFAYLLDGDFEGRFTLRLGQKDLALALELADEVGVAMIVTSLARQLYALAARSFSAEDDIVSIARLYESIAEQR